MNKQLTGMLIVVIGTGVAATFGARNPAAVNDQLEIQGRAGVGKDAQAQKEAATLEPIQPNERLSEWFGNGGAYFMMGLILIVGGSIVARQGAREAATADPAQSATSGPVVKDFGQALTDLQSSVAALATEAKAEQSPTPERFEALRERIEALQYDSVEPLVEARGRLTARHGMAGFAAVFSPFSGGERNLNRAWSALVDEHWPEATSALEISAAQFNDAKQELSQLNG